MRLLIAIFAFLVNSPASADINIVPFATSNVNVSQEYHGMVLGHIRKILSSAGNNGCQNYPSVNYYAPSVIPSDYSRLGIVTYNSQRKEINRFVERNNGNIVFVRALSACGRYEDDDRVAGCASPGSVPVVEITGTDARTDAISILHEIGHSFNISWGNPSSDRRGSYVNEKGETLEDIAHVSDRNRLMYYSITGNYKIEPHECYKYKNSSALFRRTPHGAILAGQDLDANIEQVSEETGSWIENLRILLEMKWVHGPLRLELDKIFESAGGVEPPLDEVRRIIVSNDFPQLWANSLTVLGIYGTEGDLSIIEYFLKKEVQIPDGNEQLVSNAKISAARASGRLLERYQSESAAILSSNIVQESQDVWAERLSPDVTLNVNLSGLSQEEAEFARTAIVQEVIVSQTETTAALIAGIDTEQNATILELLSESSPYLRPILEGEVVEYSSGLEAGASNMSLLLERLEPGFIEGLSEASPSLMAR